MHMADALVAPAVATTMYLCSAAAGGYSVRQVRALNEPKKVPVMGVMGAFVFATQMINFTIPGTGSSGHLCGGMLLSALLGPYAGFLTMIGVLLIQCLLFADGGLLALGCNIWNMAFYGCFIGALLIWKPMMRRGASKKNREHDEPRFFSHDPERICRSGVSASVVSDIDMVHLTVKISCLE